MKNIRNNIIDKLCVIDKLELKYEIKQKGTRPRITCSNEIAAIAEKFIEKNFPKGFTMEVDWENYNELDFYPAFGKRNKNYIGHGTTPYEGCKTYKCNFFV